MWRKKTKPTDAQSNMKIEGEASIVAQASADGEAPKQPTFVIKAYNGGLLNLSGFYRPVVIDLKTLRAGRVTVLRDHDSRQIVGQGEAEITERTITVTGKVTGDHTDKDDPAHGVVAHSKNGFVWAASVGVMPGRLELVESGQKVTVNGQSFNGPILVARNGRLGEVSFVGMGADESANAKVAANAANTGDTEMTFEAWLQAMGLVLADLSEDQVEKLQAKYKTETTEEATPIVAEQGEDPIEKRRVEAAAEETRIASIRKLCGNEHSEICAQAIRDGWTTEKTELEVIKASRPQAPNVHSSQPVDAQPLVIEAALCMTAGLREVEKQYPEKVLQAAHTGFRNYGIQQLLLAAAADAGYAVRAGERIHKGNIRQILTAAFSTIDVGGILSNVANKFLLQSFNYVESAWRQIARVGSVSDFKTITSYRLVGGGGYQKVGADGEIKHGQLGEESYSNKAETYAEMLALTRTDIINDDMSALTTGAVSKLGRDAALKLNEVFWTEFMDNAAFFHDGKFGNVVTGAALSIAGLSKAVKAFYKLKDGPSGKPTTGNFIGSTPAKLLVPVDLEIEAGLLYSAAMVNEAATADKPAPADNPHRGKYQPVASRYLSDPNITGHSTSTYYLLADPRDLAAIEVVFLDGQEVPTVETADVDFNRLGIQIRGYHDFGVNKQDQKAGVKVTA